MKALLLSLLFVSSVVACSHSPAQKPVQEDWKIKPATADQNLSLDEQFLKKSQEAAMNSRKDRKTFLHP